MVEQIPHAVRSYLETLAVGHTKTAELAQSQKAVSERYRRVAPAREGGLGIRSETEALAYSVARMPATYAVNAAVLANVRQLYPDFSPVSILDVGAGPATSTLAASSQWDLEAAALIEPNRFLSGLGGDILSRFSSIRSSWHPAEVSRLISGDLVPDDHDLVMLSYMMNEIAAHERSKLIAKLWNHCRSVLIVIETGTPLGFSVINDVRHQASSLGAAIIGPCPQAGICPLSEIEGRWCHFSARVERSRTQKALKDGATLGYEDEKFSWVALSRQPVAVPDYRIIGHPSGTKVRELQVCTKGGEAATLPVPKSSPLYKAVRKLEWGDGFSND